MPVRLYSTPWEGADERIVERARAFAAERVEPRAEAWEETRVQPEAELRLAIAEFGGLLVPRELGGQGASAVTVARVYEELAKVDLGFACGLAVHCNTTIAVSLTQNAPLRDRYLGRLLSGEAIGAFLLTEPGVGSDATAIQTTAREQGGAYRLDGEKAWVTNGATADLLAVFAQTRPGSKAKGIAGFLVEARQPGIEARASYSLLGSHAMGVNGFAFSGCEVGAEALAFGPGEGFRAAMQGIDIARFGVAALCNGALEAGLNEAVARSGQREAFGRPVIEFQGLQWQLAEVATQLEASRLLAYRTAERFDRRESATVMAAHAKKYATRAAFEGLSCCLGAMGADGLRREHPLARQLCAARVTQFMDGTTEIQNVVIGRSLLG